MLLIQKIAEEKILAAIERGELENLPGQGKPLNLDDNTAVPEELRAAYRLLKNAGYIPPEMELRKEIQQVEELLHQVESDADKDNLVRRLGLLRSRLARQGHDVSLLFEEGRYREKLLHRMSR